MLFVAFTLNFINLNQLLTKMEVIFKVAFSHIVWPITRFFEAINFKDV